MLLYVGQNLCTHDLKRTCGGKGKRVEFQQSHTTMRVKTRFENEDIERMLNSLLKFYFFFFGE